MPQQLEEIKPKTCYFTLDERRAIQSLAAQEERAESKIVQLAVRAFHRLYKQDPEKARELSGMPS
jgi:hypothetical protein